MDENQSISFTRVHDFLDGEGSREAIRWAMRAAELAVQGGYIGRVTRALEEGAEGVRVGYVVSKSQPRPHRVTMLYPEFAVTCDCQAGEHGKPCGHAGAMLWDVMTMLLIEGSIP